MTIYVPSTKEMLRSEYLRELVKLQKDKRDRVSGIDNECSDAVKALQKEYDQEPRTKAKATKREFIVMIGIVLDTGNGTTVIKIYANDHNKDDQWRKDIAKPKAGKLFEEALDKYSNHPVMIAIEESHTYCKKTILKQTVTGALRMLSKYVRDVNDKKAMELENQQLKEKLELKASFVGKAPDWELAQQMRNQGKSLKIIGDILGVSKSTVGKHTKPRPK